MHPCVDVCAADVAVVFLRFRYRLKCFAGWRAPGVPAGRCPCVGHAAGRVAKASKSRNEDAIRSVLVLLSAPPRNGRSALLSSVCRWRCQLRIYCVHLQIPASSVVEYSLECSMEGSVDGSERPALCPSLASAAAAVARCFAAAAVVLLPANKPRLRTRHVCLRLARTYFACMVTPVSGKFPASSMARCWCWDGMLKRCCLS